MLFSLYIHDLDPVIIPIYKGLALRWYGLSYLLAFVFGFYVLRLLSRRSLWVVPEEKISDFLTYAAIFGVFIGGRLGYILFYTIPEEGWRVLLEDPLLPIRVTEGGMSSHGGILGLALYSLYYAKKHKLPWLGVGDGLCIAAPLGLLLGRGANFINGELYGRPVKDPEFAQQWGVRFPTELWSNGQFSDALDASSLVSNEVSQLRANEALTLSQKFSELIAISRQDPKVLEVLGQFVEVRHCSQLYEGFLEGLVLFVLLLGLRLTWKSLPHGLITGLFFILYAVFRITVEQFREPDASLMLGGILTKGQFYSLFMVLMGGGFLAFSLIQAQKKAKQLQRRDVNKGSKQM